MTQRSQQVEHPADAAKRTTRVGTEHTLQHPVFNALSPITLALTLLLTYKLHEFFWLNRVQTAGILAQLNAPLTAAMKLISMVPGPAILVLEACFVILPLIVFLRWSRYRSFLPNVGTLTFLIFSLALQSVVAFRMKMVGDTLAR